MRGRGTQEETKYITTLNNQEKSGKWREPTDGDDVEERGATHHQNTQHAWTWTSHADCDRLRASEMVSAE